MTDFSPAFISALRRLKQDHPVLFEVVSAQWCYESNYGNSLLARASNNFSGLKCRDLSPYLPRDIWERVGHHVHQDTKGDTDPYLKCYDPADFPEVYMAFLDREVYKRASYKGKFDPFLFEDLRHPTSFLAHIADCGFCAWIPKFNGTQQELYTEYVYRVLKVRHSKKYQELMRYV